MDRHDYVTNCIYRILDCPCLAKHASQRYRDIAEAITVAARSSALTTDVEAGQQAAHDYLRAVLHKAEAGRYVQE